MFKIKIVGLCSLSDFLYQIVWLCSLLKLWDCVVCQMAVCLTCLLNTRFPNVSGLHIVLALYCAKLEQDTDQISASDPILPTRKHDSTASVAWTLFKHDLTYSQNSSTL